MTRIRAAFWACFGLTLAAACQTPTPVPGELGGCMTTNDAACSAGSRAGGGGSGGSADGGDAASDALQAGDASCGTAGELLNTSNPTCQPCIDTTCCSPDDICSNNTACVAIVSCVETNCPTSDSVCVGNCENPNQGGVSDYNDFGSCLAQCPACPQLPPGAPNGDL